MMKNGYKCLNSSCAIHKNGNELNHPFCESCAYRVFAEDSMESQENTLALEEITESTEITEQDICESFVEEIVEKKQNKMLNLLNSKFLSNRITRGVFALLGAVIIFFAFYFALGSDKKDNSEVPSSKVVFGNGKTNEVLLKLYGSNAIADKLMPELVKGYFESIGAENIKEVLLKKDGGVKMIFNMPDSTDNKEVEISKMSAEEAFDDITNKTCDIVMSSRKIKQSEIEKIMKSGLGEFSLPEHEHIIALDGIAIIVNNKNSLAGISVENLIKVFNGNIKDWSQVGGSKGKINIYASAEKSGNSDLFKNLIMGDYKIAKEAKIIEDSTELSNEVSKDINGVGFVGIPYINGSRSLPILESNGITSTPSTFNVQTEDYKLARRLYLYPIKDEQNEYIKGLIKFVSSEKGQKIVEQVDLVSQNITLIPKDQLTERKLKNGYLQARHDTFVKNAVGRLAVNIRFNDAAEGELDNKSKDDIERIVNFFNNSKYVDKKIILLGFSDSSVNFGESLTMSTKMAEGVKKELTVLNKSLEKRISTVGLSQELPISGSKDQEGIFKNRRVEIWVSSN